ncbi:MAG TPA: thiamine phosphate synthase, partial [Beijerinckiaceae bacterium]
MRALPARLLVVTDRRLARAPLEDVIADALAGGARWIWLRDRDLPRDARHALGRRLLALCAAAGATLSVGGDATDVLAIGARAAHASAGVDVRALRAALGPRALIGVSAHGADELRRARDAGADYATL